MHLDSAPFGKLPEYCCAGATNQRQMRSWTRYMYTSNVQSVDESRFAVFPNCGLEKLPEWEVTFSDSCTVLVLLQCVYNFNLKKKSFLL